MVRYWDLERCVEEIERCAELGHKGFVMSGTPEFHDNPPLADRHWDPLWDVVDATGGPIAFHAGTTMNPREYHVDPTARTVGGSNLRAVTDVVKSFLDNASACSNLLMSGVLPRYPDLKFAIVESGSGWVPFILESLDVHFLRYRPWEAGPNSKPTNCRAKRSGAKCSSTPGTRTSGPTISHCCRSTTSCSDRLPAPDLPVRT